MTPRLVSGWAHPFRPVQHCTQVKEVAPVIAGYWERAEFPHELVPKLSKLGLGGGTLTGYGCPGHSILEAAMVCRPHLFICSLRWAVPLSSTISCLFL